MSRKVEDRTGSRPGISITLGGMALNIALAILKFLGGLYGGSKALIADSLHSLSDLTSDILSLVGLHFRYKGSDTSHPYGHGKIESLTTFGIGILLFGVALWIGVDAARALYSRTFEQPSMFTILIAAISIVAKESLYRMTKRTAEEIRSEILAANAWHHRSDALTSGVILISITAAWISSSLAFLDSAAALLVSILILVISIDIMKKSIIKLIDTSPSRQLLDSVARRMGEVEGVIGVHDISGRYYADIIRMEAHIEVDPDITVAEAHRIADSAEEGIVSEFDQISSVLIHLDPYRAPAGSTDAAGSGKEAAEKNNA